MTYGAVLGGYKERREQIACSRNEDATMDMGYDQKGPCQKTNHTRGSQCEPNVDIPETETIKLVWTHQEKSRGQPLKPNVEHGRRAYREREKGA